MEQANRLYVGNLPYSVNDDGLKQMFEAVEGVVVTDAKVIMDKFTNRSKGFGFVTVADEAQAQTAIDKMNGTDVEGRKLTVNVARPMERK